MKKNEKLEFEFKRNVQDLSRVSKTYIFSLLQNDSDAEDNERTCAVGILTLRKFQGFLYNKEMTAKLQ